MPLTRRHVLLSALAAPAVLTLSRPASAREPEVFQSAGVAINGTDPVAYFSGNGPVPGSADHAVTWLGATWHFTARANREAFERDPMRHAPVFGGYCAYAASRGYLAPTQPEAWTVHEGRLYLNANLRARELWLQDIPGNIAKGQANWPGILG
ncbi:YHS domain protein [Thalassococcus profundi]|uniref:YHS domain protein n=1 Tax=Thalassococcus profundi TaxID=2282382 RepID=A0A369TM02_9RHOB|nr:YHS domain-containing (seleno)protein [Thalassococcus profundi]RDD65872.1 YHS domain protein [Thalassococcus profundi]